MVEFPEIVEAVLASKYFEPDGPLRHHYARTDGRVLVVTGENATGKSFFRQALKQYAEKIAKIPEVIDLGMHRRTRTGIERAFIYGGSDERDSTGVLSVNALLTALRTIAGRESRHILILDEPDLGLSESYARAVGELIGLHVAAMHAPTVGIVVVTHSRALVGAMTAHCQTGWLRMGGPLSLGDWLAGGAEYRSIEDLQALAGMSRSVRSQIEQLQSS